MNLRYVYLPDNSKHYEVYIFLKDIMCVYWNGDIKEWVLQYSLSNEITITETEKDKIMKVVDYENERY